LDAEEKARAKDVSGKKTVEGSSSAHVVQKILPNLTRRNSSKNSNKSPPLLLRIRRTRKRKIVSLVVSLDTILESARRLSGSRTRKQQTQLKLMQELWGMVIYCLLFFQFVIHLIGGLIQEQIFMCVLMFLRFLLIRSGGLPPC
jgi:hypothetical protein